MSYSIFRHLRQSRWAIKASPIQNLYIFLIRPFSSSLTSIKPTSDQHSFTVNYFINSCGLTSEKAIFASKYVNFKSPNKPDSVIHFFKSQGFTETQVFEMVTRLPSVLTCDINKTLLPKFEFFKSKGVSTTDMAKILWRTPIILKRSLEKQLIPSFNFFSDLLQSEEKVITAIKRFSRILLVDLETFLGPNIIILREAGVPNANIAVLLTYQPRLFMAPTHVFRDKVKEVEKMGFNPLRFKFLLAVHALRAMSKSTWEKKIECYKKWGWSEDEIFLAFGKHPWCMISSESKITEVMDFFVNVMGMDSSLLLKRPALMSLSFKQRIVPRCLVYQVLLSKGLIKDGDISFVTMLESHEKWFLKKVVYRHEEEAPALMKLYEEKLALAK